jgi:hypothetical protein
MKREREREREVEEARTANAARRRRKFLTCEHAKRNREEGGGGCIRALVSNPENKRGIIKAFIFSSTSCDTSTLLDLQTDAKSCRTRTSLCRWRTRRTRTKLKATVR